MVFSELVAWLRDSVKFVIEHAPYPLKAGLWLFAFFTFAGILSFFFSMSVACTTQGEAYTPDSPYWALKMEWERVSLDNNLNYALIDELNNTVDIYEEPAWYDRVYDSLIYLVSFGNVQNFDLEGNPSTYGEIRYTNDENYTLVYGISDVYDAQQALKYDEFVREHGTLQTDSDNEVVGVVCQNENPKLSMFGINVMDKTLWLVLSIFVILAPYLAMALNRRT